MVHLQGYGFIRVFRIVPRNGTTEDVEYWATSEQRMSEPVREHYAHLSWGIEQYHRGLKQHCGVERAQVRSARAQRNHIGCAIRAFVRRCIGTIPASAGGRPNSASSERPSAPTWLSPSTP